jgi:hypothetical protein
MLIQADYTLFLYPAEPIQYKSPPACPIVPFLKKSPIRKPEATTYAEYCLKQESGGGKWVSGHRFASVINYNTQLLTLNPIIMKKQLLFGSLLALSGFANAQWSPFPFSLNIYKTDTAGNVAIGSGLLMPSKQLEIFTNTFDDGLKITQRHSGASGVFLNNVTPRGRNYGVFSYGAGSSYAGGFGVYDYKDNAFRFHIDSTGNVGIGTITPDLSKLHVKKGHHTAVSGPNYNRYGGFFELDATADGIYTGVNSYVTADYDGNNAFGVVGHVHGNSSSKQGDAVGVGGCATGRVTNLGGSFEAAQSANTNFNVAVFGYISGNSTNNWGGWFNGPVYATAFTTVSDKNLKENIRPMSGAVDKIKQLKPSVYSYKTADFNGMNLPEGEQMGLIAQDVESVFPELIKEVKSFDKRNDKNEVVASIPGFKSVNYLHLIPLLISGAQEQQRSIEQLSAINADLQKQLDEQKQLIHELSQKMTGISSPGSPEGGFRMLQNEPNPFSNETVIRYTLPQSVGQAVMLVYDLTGKQMASFPITEKGSSALTLSSDSLVAGIYIYSIVADGKVLDSKRMVVTGK